MSYYRQSSLDNFRQFIKSSSVLNKLIIINIAIWVLISFLRVIVFLFKLPDEIFLSYIIKYLAIPASLDTLIVRPWTLFTYMFLHINVFHILFNMLWLYWFGKIFLNYLSARQLLSTYIWGGLAGGLLFIISYNIFPVFHTILPEAKALGASASVMAIVTAISFYKPNFYVQLLLLGRIRILYLAIALFIFDFFMIKSSNAGGHIAHIGGAVWGYFYIYFMKKGRDIGSLIKIDFKKFFKPFLKEKKSTFSNVHYNDRPVSDEEYNKIKADNQKKIDAILDKISKSGYEKLTKEEKEMLFNMSKKK